MNRTKRKMTRKKRRIRRVKIRMEAGSRQIRNSATKKKLKYGR